MEHEDQIDLIQVNEFFEENYHEVEGYYCLLEDILELYLELNEVPKSVYFDWLAGYESEEGRATQIKAAVQSALQELRKMFERGSALVKDPRSDSWIVLDCVRCRN